MVNSSNANPSICAHESICALGLMSGTSLDGVDAAFLVTNGETIDAFGPSHFLAYTSAQKDILKAAMQAALKWNFKGPPPKIFAQVEEILRISHTSVIDDLFLQHPDWAKQTKLIGFHGQTVLHRPPYGSRLGKTLQLGEGQSLANHVGIPVIYDFRTCDMKKGGQGAPLAPLYHKALIMAAELRGCVGVLNLGGVGNITLIEGADVWASDTGPANGPVDNWMQARGIGDYDKGGNCGRQGRVHFHLIEEWFNRGFFMSKPPRSADRYDFDVLADMSALSLEDGAATLTAYCALSVKRTLKDMLAASRENETPIAYPERIIICGGGRHNRTLLNMLRIELSPCRIETADDYRWDTDSLEAQAFAYLSVRALYGRALSLPTTTGVLTSVSGGKKAIPAHSL